MAKQKKRPAPKGARGRRLVFLGRRPVLPDPDDDEAWANQVVATARAFAREEGLLAAEETETKAPSPAGDENERSLPPDDEQASGPRPSWMPADEVLEGLTNITRADIERAVRSWQQSVDPQYANLLFAEPLTDEMRRKLEQRRSEQPGHTGTDAALEEE